MAAMATRCGSGACVQLPSGGAVPGRVQRRGGSVPVGSTYEGAAGRVAPLALSLVFVAVKYVWHYGTWRKHLFNVQNKVSLKWIHALGPSLGIVLVPGIGLIYTELTTSAPAIFSHFVTNLLVFHQVLVFICVKAVPVPHVHDEERHLVSSIAFADVDEAAG
ncbi:hypothetical protein E2562_016518 [Oryza meyeriana var. granulata]|uniref:K+ potassium transporter C-terminal domain-containing protein n=1 Tax=Oryza meyeriana var. granulata TaxID=110450 RepID=A0A6G1C557_9ORYZ|nr:hypothetical protein E2562_016518 [Oryza meyeriana var. granulata]